jgi:hypothetical protein
MDLADILMGDPSDTSRIPDWRQGVITQVSPLLVRVGSATTAKPCSALASYVPSVGDVVSVLVISGDRLVLGSLAASGGVALGVVAMAGFPFADNSVGPIGQWALTNTINATLAAGRRFRFSYTIRAVGAVAASTAFYVNLMRDGVGTVDRYTQVIGSVNWQQAHAEWIVDGDGANHNWRLDAVTAVALTFYSSGGLWYVEDVGPVR